MGKGLINGSEIINLVINALNLQHRERERDGERLHYSNRNRWRQMGRDSEA